MPTRALAILALAIAAGLAATPATRALAQPAGTTPTAVHPAMREIPDPELARMRGRFMVGNNTVVYFGIAMASSWTTAGGQQLNGSVLLGMHFGKGTQTPVITFTPTMTIVQGTPVPAAGNGDVVRSVNGAGLGNVNGLMQGIQVAGDDNRAVNVTALHVGQGVDPDATAAGTAAPFDSSVSAGDARVGIAFDPSRGVSLTLGVDGQGLVSQWIRSGSIGQLVQFTSDGQSADNQLRLDLVLGNASAATQAMRAASQALLAARAVGTGG